jgi:hypothetical protein
VTVTKKLHALERDKLPAVDLSTLLCWVEVPALSVLHWGKLPTDCLQGQTQKQQSPVKTGLSR